MLDEYQVFALELSISIGAHQQREVFKTQNYHTKVTELDNIHWYGPLNIHTQTSPSDSNKSFFKLIKVENSQSTSGQLGMRSVDTERR